jgi:hypothetical protein
MTTNTVCIKVKNLRKLGYNNVEEWLHEENNIYIGRYMRIFIDKTRVFHIKGSKWGNPFSIKENGLYKCLEKYKEHLKHSNLLPDIEKELKGKTLGCWCKHSEINGVPQCHAQILINLIKE